MQSTDSVQALSNYQWHFFFFSQNWNKILQFVWKHKRPQIAKAIFKKKNVEDGGGIGRVISFSSTNSLKDQQNGEQSLQNNF